MDTCMLLAIFLARRAFAPKPGAWFTGPFVALPRGAWGTTTWAACDGLCRGWTWTGEAEGVELADMTMRETGNAVMKKSLKDMTGGEHRV